MAPPLPLTPRAAADADDDFLGRDAAQRTPPRLPEVAVTVPVVPGEGSLETWLTIRESASGPIGAARGVRAPGVAVYNTPALAVAEA